MGNITLDQRSKAATKLPQGAGLWEFRPGQPGQQKKMLSYYAFAPDRESQQPSTQSPQIDPDTYYNFIQELNNKVVQDPELRGRAFVISPPESSSDADRILFDAALRKKALETLESRDLWMNRGMSSQQDRADELERYATVDNLSRNISEKFNKKNKRQGFSIASRGGTISSTSPTDPGYIAAAVAVDPRITARDYISQSLSAPHGQGISVSDDFSRGISSTFLHKFIATHELGHGLLIPRSEKGETASVLAHREEVTQDSFAALYLIQSQEPQAIEQLSNLAAYRQARMIVEGSSLHDTSSALQRIVADAQNGVLNLQGRSLNDLVKLAEKYGKEDIQRQYPHLYTTSSASDKELQERTKIIENKNNAITQYAHNQWRGQGPKIDHPLDAQEAAQLIRLSDAADKVSGNRGNKLAQEVDRLRKLQPDIFNAAYQSLGIEPPPLQKTSQDIKKSPMQTAMATGPGIGF